MIWPRLPACRIGKGGRKGTRKAAPPYCPEAGALHHTLREAHVFPAFLTQNHFLCLEEGVGEETEGDKGGARGCRRRPRPLLLPVCGAGLSLSSRAGGL